MCGIVGTAGKVGFKEEKVFRTLLILDSLRGEHSTGVAAVGKSTEVTVAKVVGDPFALLETKQSEAIFKQPNRILIGHNRYATTGKINRRNAHPFEFDTIVGVHNGTLTNKYALTDQNLFDVDSEALYHNIEKHGLEEAIGKTKGAWALVWWDKKKESVNVLRNAERTLFFVWSEDKQTLFWASEMWMLSVALSRNEIKFDKIESFEVDKHYEFCFDFKTDKLEEPVITKIQGKKEDFYPKKATTASGRVGNLIDDKYLGKSSTFKIITSMRDEDGADYLEVVDQSDTPKMVRVYLHKQEALKQKTGYFFNGDVVGMKRSKSGLLFYKVSVKSPLYLPKEKAAIINLHSTKKKKEIKDQSGFTISEADLIKHYSTCGWCSQDVDHSLEGHLYLDGNNGAICRDCTNLPEVKLFV